INDNQIDIVAELRKALDWIASADRQTSGRLTAIMVGVIRASQGVALENLPEISEIPNNGQVEKSNALPSLHKRVLKSIRKKVDEADRTIDIINNFLPSLPTAIRNDMVMEVNEETGNLKYSPQLSLASIPIP